MEKQESLVVFNEVEVLATEVMKARADRIKELAQSIMTEGVHYGRIPGCGTKPSLWKPGAEKLLMAFQLTVKPVVINLSTPEEIRYQVIVNIHTVSGVFVGAGVGEASSREERYAWRAAVCDQEWEQTPAENRRIKFSRKTDNGGEEVVQVKQVRTNPADVANTVLKMAKKRALIDATLTVLGASDIFTQDIEDLPVEIVLGPSVTNPEPGDNGNHGGNGNGKDGKGSPEFVPATDRQRYKIGNLLEGIGPDVQGSIFKQFLGREVDSYEEIGKKDASRIITFLLNNELKLEEMRV